MQYSVFRLVFYGIGKINGVNSEYELLVVGITFLNSLHPRGVGK